MPNTHVRVLGGGNTYVTIGVFSKDNGDYMLEFCSQFSDTPGNAVGSVQPIQPIGQRYPIEIATPYAQDAGTIEIQVWGTWGSDGWVSAFQTRDGQDTGASPWNPQNTSFRSSQGDDTHPTWPVDLVEVMEAQRKLNDDATIVIRKWELGKTGDVVRVKEYEGVVISNINARESFQNNTMTQTCTITFRYTKSSVSYRKNQ